MSGRWHIHVEDGAFRGRSLWMTVSQAMGRRAVVGPMVLTDYEPGSLAPSPTLAETQEDQADGVGDVTGFLQAALDAAWSVGLRPRGFADHTNELTAVRYHLEDMRTLAMPKKE